MSGKLKTNERQWAAIRAAIHRHCPVSSTPCMMCEMYLAVLDDLAMLISERAASSQGHLDLTG